MNDEASQKQLEPLHVNTQPTGTDNPFVSSKSLLQRTQQCLQLTINYLQTIASIVSQIWLTIVFTLKNLCFGFVIYRFE